MLMKEYIMLECHLYHKCGQQQTQERNQPDQYYPSVHVTTSPTRHLFSSWDSPYPDIFFTGTPINTKNAEGAAAPSTWCYPMCDVLDRQSRRHFPCQKGVPTLSDLLRDHRAVRIAVPRLLYPRRAAQLQLCPIHPIHELSNESIHCVPVTREVA